jgi:putative nucleotidyltransferase with HDIG domain
VTVSSTLGLDAATAEAAVVRAADLATELLRTVGTRFAHTRMVASQATIVCDQLDEPWKSALVPAAWLHDIGYSQELARTGFHPLDGARYLRDGGWPPEVCRLVAWHTGAGVEADLRRLRAPLDDEFEPPVPRAAAAMAWADLTSSPSGELCSPQERLDEILHRYPPGSLVYRAVSVSRAQLLAAANEVDTMVGRLQPM